jgi:hypothetical protein
MTTAEYKIEAAPAQEVFDWIKRVHHPKTARISGKSLKFIRSRLPIIVFVMSNADFENFKKSGLLPDNNENADEKIIISQNEVKFITETFPQTYHFIYRPESSLEAKEELQLSTDFLIYDEEKLHWTGDTSGLRNLDEEKLVTIFPSEFTNIEILQICALTSMLNFQIEEDFLYKLRESYKPENNKLLSKRFTSKIFRNIVTGAKPSNGFIALDKIGALDWFLPELARGIGLSQNQYHKFDIFYHSIYTCDAVPEPDIVLRLAALFHDLGKVDTRKVKSDGEASFHNHEMVSVKHTDRIMKRFGFDAPAIKHVKFLVRNHMFHYTNEWSDKAIRRFINKVGPDDLEELIKLRLADRKGSGKRTALPRAIKEMMRHIEEVRAKESEFKIKDLAIDGHILQEMGVNPGPLMGQILQQLLDDVMDGKLENEADTLRKAAAELIVEQIK